jgi:hypothetical protein
VGAPGAADRGVPAAEDANKLIVEGGGGEGGGGGEQRGASPPERWNPPPPSPRAPEQAPVVGADTRHRAIIGGARKRRGGAGERYGGAGGRHSSAPRTLEEEEAGLLQFEVSSTFPVRP